MLDMAMLLAEMMPEDFLIEEIQKASTEYLMERTEIANRKLMLLASMFLTKAVIKGKAEEGNMSSFEAMLDLRQRFEEAKKREDLFNPSKQ